MQMGTLSGQSHQLRNGLYVSGRPDSHSKADKTTAMASLSAPYTGGDLNGSGELGKMFDIPKLQPARSGSGPCRKTSSTSSSSSSSLFSSGPNPLQPTGLITSEPLRRSGPHDSRSSQGDPAAVLKKPVYGSAVTSLKSGDPRVAFKISRVITWLVAITVVMGLVVGAFFTLAARKVIILAAFGAVLFVAAMGMLWNFIQKRNGFLAYLRKFREVELRGAVDGQLVKVTGIVTCGSIPLESSYQKVARCVYVSTEVYERRGWCCKAANPKLWPSSWVSKYAEKHVADFYISDFQSGLRALVKAGYGAKVVPFVEPGTDVDMVKDGKEISPTSLDWLANRSLSSDDQTIRVRESYIKEGSSISVVGVVRRHENMLMVVAPEEPIATGFQWLRCLLPTCVEGLALICEDSEDGDVIPV